MEELISEYGYTAVFFGTFLEGETVLVIGGFFAQRTYLELPWVITAAFLGTLCGDQAYYYLGRIKGVEFLENRPRWKRKSAKVLELLHRHQTLVALSFRFFYGVRTVVPFLIGTSRVPRVRFLVLNAIGIAVWSLAVGIAGYTLGRTAEAFLADVETYDIWILVVLAAAGGIGWLIWWRRERRTNSRTGAP